MATYLQVENLLKYASLYMILQNWKKLGEIIAPLPWYVH